MTARTVAVAGLGLIGGSLARDLAERGVRVLGHDSNEAALEGALEDGVIVDSLGPDLARAADAEWLVLAAPIDASIAMLERLLPHLGNVRLVTDTGSTKRGMETAALRLGIGPTFVGSHPFTGDHRAGWAASRAGLFAGGRVYLCPTEQTSDDAIAEADALWSLCGASTHCIDAAEHDALLAWTSHLPQVLSTLLATSMATADVPVTQHGRGARDMLRLAASDASVWTPVALDNADNLAAALGQLEQTIAAFRAAAAAGDRDAIATAFRAGAAYAGRLAR